MGAGAGGQRWQRWPAGASKRWGLRPGPPGPGPPASFAACFGPAGAVEASRNSPHRGHAAQNRGAYGLRWYFLNWIKGLEGPLWASHGGTGDPGPSWGQRWDLRGDPA